MKSLISVALSALLVTVVTPFPNGAPTCFVGAPNHVPFQPQPENRPPIPTEVTSMSDGSFRISIGSINSLNLFKGFRLVANTRPALGLGQWIHMTPNLTKFMLDEEGNPCGVTHKDNKNKTAVDFEFRPPENADEIDGFRVDGFSTIVVQQFNRFWTEVEFQVQGVELSEFKVEHEDDGEQVQVAGGGDEDGDDEVVVNDIFGDVLDEFEEGDDINEDVAIDDKEDENVDQDPKCQENPCIFPFNFADQTFESCTDFEHIRLWCSTSNDDRGEMLEWRNCGPCEGVKPGDDVVPDPDDPASSTDNGGSNERRLLLPDPTAPVFPTGLP